MTKRQLEKELNRQAVLFEEQVRDGNICDGSIRFKEFSELFMQRHANPNLKEKTSYEYQAKLARINQAIGHIRLTDLKLRPPCRVLRKSPGSRDPRWRNDSSVQNRLCAVDEGSSHKHGRAISQHWRVPLVFQTDESPEEDRD